MGVTSMNKDYAKLDESDATKAGDIKKAKEIIADPFFQLLEPLSKDLNSYRDYTFKVIDTKGQESTGSYKDQLSKPLSELLAIMAYFVCESDVTKYAYGIS